MKKLDYKLFFYTGEKPLNDNKKDINLNPSLENIEINNKISNNEKQRNFSNKVKQQYNFHLKRNKNIILFKKKSTPGKITSKDYSENKEILEKEDKNDGLSLLSFIPKKKEIYKNKNLEEFKKLQRNKVTKRRIEYSKRVKNIEANKNRYRNNTKKIITIQKWVRGFIIRNLISNLNCFEDFRNEVLDHLKKFVFLKLKRNMQNVIKYFENKVIEEGKKNNLKDKNEQRINDNKDINGISLNKNEVMSFADNLNVNKNSLDVIKENSNERYIDEDSIMEYNNRYKNKKNNEINNNILFLSSKDFSENNMLSNSKIIDSNLILLSSNNNNVNIKNMNNTPFILNESSILYEDTKKMDGENNNKNKDKKETLNSYKEDILSTLKNEEVRDIFNAKHNNNLIEPSSSLVNNIINNKNDLSNNNKELFIKRPKLNRKFIEEISNTQSFTPLKKDNSVKIDENKNIFKKIEYNFLNNSNENENNINIENKVNKEENVKEKTKNDAKINNYIKKVMEKEIGINDNENNNKIKRKINYINSIKTNQFCSISNPANTTKENTSTLDSNSININRKLFLDDNLSISNNNKTISENIKNINKPINKPMIITKIRLKNNKIDEYLVLKYSHSEKKSLPKQFDLNYQDTNENNLNTNNNINNNINNSNSFNNNVNIDNNINNNIDRSISNDMNINILNVVNNNVDELNNSIKNIVKEGVQLENDNQNKINIFGKSIRALLDLDKPTNNINIINDKEIENNINDVKEEINVGNNENKKNVLNQMSIEEIKEVKEEYEDEKDSELNFTQKKIYNSNEILESSKEIDNILDNNCIMKSIANNQKNNNFVIVNKNISFNILSRRKNNKSDRSQIFIIFLIMKQMKFSVKPYIFNFLKNLWLEKLNR